MATARYTRIDNNRGPASSGFCSKIMVVMFVGLCLVGVWMLTSSSVVPVENTDLSQENKNEASDRVTETKGGNSRQFEDNPGDLPSDATKEEVSSSSVQNEGRSNPQDSSLEKSDPKPQDKSTDESGDPSAGESGSRTENDVQGSGVGDRKSGDNSGDSEEPSADKKSFSDTSDSKSKLDEGEKNSSASDVDSKFDSDYSKNKSDSDDSNKYDSEDSKKKIDSDYSDKKYDSDYSKKKSHTDGSEKKYDADYSKKESDIGDSDKKYGSDDTKKKSDIGDSDKKYGSDDSKKKSYSDDSEKKYGSDVSKKKFDSDDRDKKKSDSYDGRKKYNSDDSEKKYDSDNSEKKYDSDAGNKKSDLEDSKKKSDTDDTEKRLNDSSGETQTLDKKDSKTNETVDQDDRSEVKSDEKKGTMQGKNESSNEAYPSGKQSELLNETTTYKGSFSTQATESKNEKEAQKSTQKQANFSWKLCNVTAGPDFIPCLDNLDAIKHLPTTKHYEHRERHCPEKPPTCLVPLPEGYKRSVQWPKCRDKIWYSNVPHAKLAEIKGHQNWVKVTGEYLTFPGGGTQFKHGALHYIDFVQESLPDIAWGNHSRVVLDVGCGVASLGGYLFDRDVLTMSLAPKDEHEAQVQFALERGIPAISAVMGTTRLPFPGRVFDIVHCARCRVPWHIEGGKLLLELNRVLRPGGFFVWSATPVYQKLDEDVEIWTAMKKLTKDMCWETVSIVKDTVNRVGIAIYKKPDSNECYKNRSQNDPPLCSDSDDPNAAWNVTLQACLHKVPVEPKERGSKWPEQWPARLGTTPYWLQSSQTGVYGKPAPDDFAADYEHWKSVVSKTYLNGMGINWSSVRNVMDMRAVYGGFAAALKDLSIWVMNVVAIDSADTLPIIYERGLFGIYHDWCESFSTYPRSYDLLHADHLFSRIQKKCSLVALIAEVDRMLRPEGKLIVQDDVKTLGELESMFKAMQWEILKKISMEKEGMLCIQKSMWRPKESETLPYAIG